jgi:predicted nucleotide-binding protein (sugar kinase/HSP70/actin superfamily)
LKMLLHTRPYEINRGESGNVFNRAVEALLSGIIQRDFEEALVKGLKSMTHIPVNRSAEKPIIGIVGEIYSCINPWANNGIIETLEGLGAEVRLGPTLLDYTAYFNECYPQMRFSQRRYLESLLYYLRKTWCLNRLDHIEGMMGEDLKDCKISRVKEIIEMARPYVSEAIDPVVTVNVARAKDYARKGVSGIANLIILNCLYGTLSTAIYKKIQREYGGLPILNMIYDGLKQTNEKTRIEAFLHQAKTYISQG